MTDRSAAETATGHGHIPVMRDRMRDLLAPAITRENADGAGAVLIDGTLGAGGHAEFFLTSFPGLHLIGFDRDAAALAGARERLAPFSERTSFVHATYDEVARGLADGDGPACELARTQGGVDAALYDLGVSSMQLDQVERGFAYATDAPLDMRMNQSTGMTAADVLNTYSHGDLARVLKVYGDERFAGKIASAVLTAREQEPFTTSARLVELLYATIPAAARRTGGHPAKRTFQALRVEVNGELASLTALLPAIADALRIGGRVAFMSYQSAEDRIVKHGFAELTTSSSPPGLPMDLPGTEPSFRLITRGAEQATDAEIAANPRAKPARVRAAEKLRPLRH